MKILCKFSFLLLSAFYLLLAENYSVSSASDIHAIMASAQPGDSLKMTAGIWRDQSITFKCEGTEEQPVVLCAEVPGELILTGKSTLRISGSYLTVSGLYFSEGYTTGQGVIEFRDGSGNRANNCRLTETAIINYNASITTNYKWVSLYGKNNRVDHCYFYGKSHNGTTLVVWLSDANRDQENHHLIDHNYFAYRPPLGFNGGETIRIGTSSYSLTNSRTVVEYNLFEECNGETEIISNKSCENIYRHNTFRRNEGCLTLRHGNRCIVEGNFFFGEFNQNAGGVRIIGENHVVTNNYFQELYGSGYKSALTIVKGVENSPLNRYFPVKNALIAHNTFYDCRYSINLNYGSSDDQTVAPVNCTIVNNAVYSPAYDIIDANNSYADMTDFTWDGNIFYGQDIGDDPGNGFSWTDPFLESSDDELYRPGETSPLIAAAAGNYIPSMTMDIDGHSRSGTFDVGADQVSKDPVIYRPLSAEDVGPSWEVPEIVIPKPGRVEVASSDDLADIIENSLEGDTLVLVDDAIYNVKEPIRLSKNLYITSEFENAAATLTINNPTYSSPYFLQLLQGGNLILENITFDGLAGSDSPAKYFIRTTDDGINTPYQLKILNCRIRNIIFEDEGMVFRAYKGSIADSIVIRNSRIDNIGRYVLNLWAEDANSGLVSAKNVLIENSTFSNVQKEVLYMYGGDELPMTLTSGVNIDHCTFYQCGLASTPVINGHFVDALTLKNSVFLDCSPSSQSIRLYHWSFLDHTNFWNSGDAELLNGANSGSNIYSFDPLYTDPAALNFSPSEGSLLLSTPADDDMILGDTNWYQGIITSMETSEEMNYPVDFQLGVYPNPFNASFTVRLNAGQNAAYQIDILDVRGAKISSIPVNRLTQGRGEMKVDTEEWQSGVYLLLIRSGKDILAKKKICLLK